MTQRENQRVDRRQFVQASAATTIGLTMGGSLLAQTKDSAPRLKIGKLLRAPTDPEQWPAWREELHQWRKQTREALQYDDSFYRREEFLWGASSFSCCLAMMCDLTFYDSQKGRYSVESFLEHGLKEFGGFDSVVFWHAYPRIGFDPRNQFDFYRDMPGGLPGLREVSRRFHAANVKVFVNYNPWDIGTRREEASDLVRLVELVQAIEADGLFLDTLKKGGETFRTKLDQGRPGVVLESELALPVEGIQDHHLSWAQWFRDSQAPGVLRNKWFERRHMQHQIARWDDDHTSELHMAWMNGSGMMVWENVFGSLKLWSPRDRSLLRSMLPIQRRYQDLFASEGWKPLVPTATEGVYASLWHGCGLRLWTLVNRTDEAVEGRLPLVGQDSVEQDDLARRYFDLMTGQEIGPVKAAGGLSMTVPLRPRGVGGIVSGTEAALGEDFLAFLAAQKELDASADFSPQAPLSLPEIQPVALTKKYRIDNSPADMCLVNVDQEFEMRLTVTSRECGTHVAPYTHDPDQDPNVKKLLPMELVRKVRLHPYAIDQTPVTNTQFAEFLKSSGYQPKHPENFLKHWNAGKPPHDSEEHPVVYVDLDDARHYALWAGKRLPTEEEWQYAAAGPESLAYPWGNEMEPGHCNAGESAAGTTPVKAFPSGRSPLGCYDMCGNTWEWTESQQSDGRTRFCMIKGGSWYQAEGSYWYTDGGPQPTHHAAKFLLMWPGLDRCSTIGFRCVVDLTGKNFTESDS